MTAPREMSRRDYTLILCSAVPFALGGLALTIYALCVATVTGVVWAAGVMSLPAGIAAIAWRCRRDLQ